MLSFQGWCEFKGYMPRKPHKWGVVLYQLCVRLRLSGKPYSMDFEPSMADDIHSESTRSGPLVAAFRLVERMQKHAWCSLHIAMDSAFSKPETFSWLSSQALYCSCAIASGMYAPTSMLSLGLEDDHCRLFYSAKQGKMVSVLKDRGRKKEATVVITMSNAFVPEANVNGTNIPVQHVSIDDYMPIATLPEGSLQLLCSRAGCEYVPSHPHATAFNLTGFEYSKYVKEVMSVLLLSCDCMCNCMCHCMCA